MEKATAQNAVESRDVVEACTDKIIDAMEKNTRKSSRSNWSIDTSNARAQEFLDPSSIAFG